MTLPPPLLAKSDYGDIAQLLIFMVLAIGGAIQHVLKKRAEERRKTAGMGTGKDHGAEPTERAPARPPPLRRPPETASGGPPVRPPVFPAPRAQTPAAVAHGHAAGTHGSRVVILADPEKRVRALTGQRLLFAKNPSPRDRVRAAVLWHEALQPPPSLGG